MHLNLNFSLIELFKDFATDLSINENYYDLHNDFNCILIRYDLNLSELIIEFKHRKKNTKISLIFIDTEIYNLKFIPVLDELIIDQIYRGTFMEDNSKYCTKAEEKGYFYLSFLPEFDIELFAESIIILEVIE